MRRVPCSKLTIWFKELGFKVQLAFERAAWQNHGLYKEQRQAFLHALHPSEGTCLCHTTPWSKICLYRSWPGPLTSRQPGFLRLNFSFPPQVFGFFSWLWFSTWPGHLHEVVLHRGDSTDWLLLPGLCSGVCWLPAECLQWNDLTQQGLLNRVLRFSCKINPKTSSYVDKL